MLKRLVAWRYGIAVVVILGGSVYVSRQDQKIRDQYKHKCGQLNAVAASPTSHHEDCDAGAANAARYLPRWYQVFAWPEGITTWGILLTLIVIAEQTAQTRVAAQAALDQITLMKVKERADMFIRFGSEEFVHPTLWASQEYPELAVSFVVYVRNVGMTKAKNVAFYGAASVTSNKGFPAMSGAQRVVPFQDLFKADSDEVGVEISTGKPFPTVEDGERVRVETASLHLYGFVAFTDAFGDRHITPFRWLWKSEEFDVDGITADSSGWIDVAWVGDARTKEPYYYEHKAI